MLEKPYVTRTLDNVLPDLLNTIPGVMIVGPRATGKSTTARRYAKTVINLDAPNQSAYFRADPDAAIQGLPEPVLFDEWQEVPAILGALKRSIDVDYRPGRFLLTGSVTSSLDQSTWPATGRLGEVSMFGLTIAERIGVSRSDFLRRLETASNSSFQTRVQPPNLRDYVQMASESGFPEALRISNELQRTRWLQSYIHNILSRDALANRIRRNSILLENCLQAIAATMATTTTETALSRSAGTSRSTFLDYERMLEAVFAIDRIPGWSSNHFSRLRTSPKRYVIDTGLGIAALGQDVESILRDADLLGKVLDSFVLAQLRPEIAQRTGLAKAFHLRQNDARHEVDLVIELAARRVLALEVKATAHPSVEDAKHLKWLRDQLQDRFVAGAVLHTGPRPFRLSDRIYALPIYSLWTPNVS